MVQLSHPYMTTGKTIPLTRWTFVEKVMTLLINTLSTLVIAFLLRSKGLLISWLQSQSSVTLEPKKIFCYCFHGFPTYMPWRDGTRCHDLIFMNAEFLAKIFTLLFQFNKRHFSSSLSAIRVVSSAYLRLLVFLPTILLPACSSFSPVFFMMYSAYKLNKQGNNTQPWCTRFSIFPEKHLLLIYWVCQSLWLCGSQQTVENSERDGNTTTPDLPLE